VSAAPALRDGSLARTERSALRARLDAAARRARRAGAPVLAAHTVRVAPSVDPAAVAFASRRPGERWFCFEQPSRARTAIAALGSVVELAATGRDRFARVAERWRGLAAEAVADPGDGPPGSGLVAVGRFGFSDGGGASPH